MLMRFVADASEAGAWRVQSLQPHDRVAEALFVGKSGCVIGVSVVIVG